MTPEELQSGGAPLLGEPLPIELANATYAVRGRLTDGLQTVGNVAAWFRDNRDRFSVPLGDQDLLAATRADLAAARELRDAVRALASASVCGGEPPREVIEVVNRLARSTSRWRELSWGEGPQAHAHSSGRPVDTALAEIAQRTVDFFSGAEVSLLRACNAPGCVLYFVKDHPRREWCSPACGNRARAARHYERSKRAR